MLARCSSQRESCNMHVKRLPSRRFLYTLRMERMVRRYPKSQKPSCGKLHDHRRRRMEVVQPQPAQLPLLAPTAKLPKTPSVFTMFFSCLAHSRT